MARGRFKISGRTYDGRYLVDGVEVSEADYLTWRDKTTTSVERREARAIGNQPAVRPVLELVP